MIHGDSRDAREKPNHTSLVLFICEYPIDQGEAHGWTQSQDRKYISIINIYKEILLAKASHTVHNSTIYSDKK